MTSSSNITKYPPRLYEEGKSLLQNRSMNHNCFLNKIGIMKLELGEDVWTELRESSLGVFIKLTEEPYTWTTQIVHYFLTHQLAVKNIHEIWSLIDGRPIRFSLNEFEDITKLNCNPIDEADNWDANHHDFWKKMEVPLSDGPTYKELEKVMARWKTFSFEERMMVGRLCLLSVGIYGIHHASRVPLSSAKRALDPDAFEKHPWGRVAFSSLVKSIKVVEYANDSYVIHGCVHALLIWVYESVPGLGESFGKRRSILTGYPLLDWESSRKRINFEDFLKKEKAAYEKVRVRHMVDVSEENMYPNWSDANEKKDTELDNLIKDIIHKRLPVNAWEGVDALCLKKNKRKVEENVHRQRGRTQKKEKMKEDYSTDEEEEKVSNKKYKMGEEHSEDVKGKEKSLLDILKMLETMNGTISDLDKNIRGRMDALETRFESLVNEKATFLDAQLSKMIDTLEKDLKDMKESKPGVVHDDDGHSKNNLDDEADSQALSWMVEYKQTSKDELPVHRVVRKVYTVKNKKKKKGEIYEDLFLFEKKDATNVHKKKIDIDTSKKGGIQDGKKPITVKIEKKDSPQLIKKKKRAKKEGRHNRPSC